jgi:hypothetical protein
MVVIMSEVTMVKKEVISRVFIGGGKVNFVDKGTGEVVCMQKYNFMQKDKDGMDIEPECYCTNLDFGELTLAKRYRIFTELVITDSNPDGKIKLIGLLPC